MDRSTQEGIDNLEQVVTPDELAREAGEQFRTGPERDTGRKQPASGQDGGSDI